MILTESRGQSNEVLVGINVDCQEHGCREVCHGEKSGVCFIYQLLWVQEMPPGLWVCMFPTAEDLWFPMSQDGLPKFHLVEAAVRV